VVIVRPFPGLIRTDGGAVAPATGAPLHSPLIPDIAQCGTRRGIPDAAERMATGRTLLWRCSHVGGVHVAFAFGGQDYLVTTTGYHSRLPDQARRRAMWWARRLGPLPTLNSY